MDREFTQLERAWKADPNTENGLAFLRAILRSGCPTSDAWVTQVARSIVDHVGIKLPSARVLNNDAGSCELCSNDFHAGDQGFYLSTLRSPEFGLPGDRSPIQLGWNLTYNPDRTDTRYYSKQEGCTCNGYNWTPPRGRFPKFIHTRGCPLTGLWGDKIALPFVWEHLVHVDCADEHGYKLPKNAKLSPERMGLALDGTRTKGYGNHAEVRRR